jgi:hypothetical protein
MRTFLRIIGVLFTLLLLAVVIATGVGFRYAYEPPRNAVISRVRNPPAAYDLWGRVIARSEAQALLTTQDGRSMLSPHNGAVAVNDEVLRLGRTAFYQQTFDNELFLTDVLGMLDGPLRLTNVASSILSLRGRATTNLRVRVPQTVVIGGRTFQKGELLDTGLDVPRGAPLPLGIAVAVSGWKVRIGITCALCHATVDGATGKVIEGAPNQDLNAGLLIALASNSAAYFMHTDVDPHGVRKDPQRTVRLSTGEVEALPDRKALEDAVDAALLMWPRGNFDSLTDLAADPTQLPTSYTWRNHPFGWSGNFTAGPFRGLSAQNNNVHALNSDALLLADSSRLLFDLDKEEFLAILLQCAPSARYRFDPASGTAPSAWLAATKPSDSSPGLNAVVPSPTYPKGNLLTPDGTLSSSPDHLLWEENNAMAAWQDTLLPPPARIAIDATTRERGRAVFERAGCVRCHSGPFLTNNQVIPSEQLGVNPVRAQALRKTRRNFAGTSIYAFDTPVPVPADATVLPVPLDRLDIHQIDLAWDRDESGGGYKVPSLVGLYWSAPYLHDGGVAVGPDASTQLGLPGTVQVKVAPDPGNSLRALLDRELRARVVAANAASEGLVRMNVQGVGHHFWVDRAAGFSTDEQRLLVAYLLTFEPPE